MHVAAHLGGGAGKAISGIALQGQRLFGDTHRVMLLQPPEKSGYVQACLDGGVDVMLWDGGYDQLAGADVVVVSWWNHPAMARFLRQFPLCGAGLVLWCHVNGCHYPHLPSLFVQAFDGILFTSPYSLHCPSWTVEERENIAGRAAVVYGMGNFEPKSMPAKPWKSEFSGFCIGYVGTLNYGKIHPAFVEFCKAAYARVPAVRFVLAGDRDVRLEADIQSAGLWERFSFPGFVSDVPALMRTFDVFGYLLNPEHYGTTENALLESMACGVPAIVLRQNVEQYIVPHNESFLVSSPEEYGERIEFLWKDPLTLKEMGRQVREYVLEQYNSSENAACFQRMCLRTVQARSGLHDFPVVGDTPWQWFCFCLGSVEREQFQRALAAVCQGGERGRKEALYLLRHCPPILRERRKSSLRHFAEVYPEDGTLRLFVSLLDDLEVQ